MKKVILLFTAITLILTVFTGCSKANTDVTNDTVKTIELSDEESYYLELAKKTDSYADVFDILKVYNSKDFQMALANSENNIVLEALLNYEKLDSEVLVAICKNPQKLYMDAKTIQNYFINAICNADLTLEQELEIAKIRKYPMQMGMFSRENLNGDTLVFLIESNNKLFNLAINCDSYKMKTIVFNQIVNTELTLEQRDKLKSLDITNVNKALVEKEKQEKSEIINGN